MYKKIFMYLLLIMTTGFLFAQEIELSQKEKEKYKIETLKQLYELDLRKIPVRNIDISPYILVEAIPEVLDIPMMYYRSKDLRNFFKYIKKEDKSKYNAFKNFVIGKMLLCSQLLTSDLDYQKKITILANKKIGQELHQLVHGTGLYTYFFKSNLGRDILKSYLKMSVVCCIFIKCFFL